MAWHVLKQYTRSFGTGFIIGLPIYVTITDLGFCIARVDGISMQPSLNPIAKESDIVFLNRWRARDVYSVRRGDVVSLTCPSDPDTKLIKRIIGLEGDVIKTIGYKKRLVSIPKGHCWVEGDHRGKSFDSNKFGPVSLGLVSGVATHVVWPPKRWMKLDTSVEKDRKPLRRSFNQCTFSDMLEHSKEANAKLDSDEKRSTQDRYDVVAMKRKLLSDDRLLGHGSVSLSDGSQDRMDVSGPKLVEKNDSCINNQGLTPNKETLSDDIVTSHIPVEDDLGKDHGGDKIERKDGQAVAKSSRGVVEDLSFIKGAIENCADDDGERLSVLKPNIEVKCNSSGISPSSFANSVEVDSAQNR